MSMYVWVAFVALPFHVWVVFVSKDGAFFLLGQTLIFLLPLTVIGSGSVSYTHLTLPTNREV